MITNSTLIFLKDLQENNNRPWFNTHKDRYLEAHAEMIVFAESLIERMSHHDEIETMTGKQSLYRIYRDTRFSKIKTPYKRSFGGRMRRATKFKRGGYYFEIEPGNSFIAGGFWRPNPADMKRIREELAADPDTFRNIITAPDFVDTFGGLLGEQVKTAPRGYTKDHPAIDLLRYKQFLVRRDFTDAQVLAPNFMEEAVKTYLTMHPFFNFMSDVLTTDSNGEIIA